MNKHPHGEIVVRFCAQEFGPVEPLALIEIIPTDPPIAVHACPADGVDGVTTLFTTGLSDRPMTVPDEPGARAYRFAELFIQLPANWNYREIRDLAQAWPLHWLRKVAKYPHHNDTWLGAPITVIANGDPPAPLADGVPFVAFLLLTSDEAEDRLLASDGRVIHFYRVFPLYPDEYKLEREQGIEALIKLFQKHKIGMTVDLNRKNVAKAKGR